MKKQTQYTKKVHLTKSLRPLYLVSKKIWDRIPLSTVFPTVINLANRKVPGVHSNIISLEKSLYTLAD